YPPEPAGVPADGRLVFFLPKKGTLGNRRRHPRVVLDGAAENLRAVVRVRNQAGEREFETGRLLDISQGSLGLFLDRSQGLALEGDEAVSLKVYRGEALALEVQGTVARTDMKPAAPGAPRTYFAAVCFSPPPEDNVVPFRGVERRVAERLRLEGPQAAQVEAGHPL